MPLLALTTPNGETLYPDDPVQYPLPYDWEWASISSVGAEVNDSVWCAAESASENDTTDYFFDAEDAENLEDADEIWDCASMYDDEEDSQWEDRDSTESAVQRFADSGIDLAIFEDSEGFCATWEAQETDVPSQGSLMTGGSGIDTQATSKLTTILERPMSVAAGGHQVCRKPHMRDEDAVLDAKQATPTLTASQTLQDESVTKRQKRLPPLNGVQPSTQTTADIIAERQAEIVEVHALFEGRRCQMAMESGNAMVSLVIANVKRC